jgi:hypothetical protein
MKTTTINLGYLNEKTAAKVYNALNGKTYMNFCVNRGVVPSGIAVTITTDYDATHNEISGKALHVLAEAML